MTNLKTTPVLDAAGKLIGHECNLSSIREVEKRIWISVMGMMDATLPTLQAAKDYLAELGEDPSAAEAHINVRLALTFIGKVKAEAKRITTEPQRVSQEVTDDESG